MPQSDRQTSDKTTINISAYGGGPIGEGIKQCFRLTSVCLSVAYISGLTREQRGIGRLK